MEYLAYDVARIALFHLQNVKLCELTCIAVVA